MSVIHLHTLPDQILNAPPEEFDSLIDALQERFSELHPGWELLTVTVRGHTDADRITALEKSIALLSHITKNDLP